MSNLWKTFVLYNAKFAEVLDFGAEIHISSRRKIRSLNINFGFSAKLHISSYFVLLNLHKMIRPRRSVIFGFWWRPAHVITNFVLHENSSSVLFSDIFGISIDAYSSTPDMVNLRDTAGIEILLLDWYIWKRIMEGSRGSHFSNLRIACSTCLIYVQYKYNFIK